MDWVAAGLGFTGGLVAHLFQKFIDDGYLRWKAPVREVEKELLRIAIKADGHLQFRKDFPISGPPLLWMTGENWRWPLKLERFEDTGQTENLLTRRLIILDPESYEAGYQRWILTPRGWAYARKLGKPKSLANNGAQE